MSVKYVFNPTTATIEATDKVSFNGEVEAGTAASPSIFFTNDPNTGIYSPSADTLAIATGGTGRLFVDSTGRILVGYTSGRGATATQHIYGIPTGTSYFEIRNESTSGQGDILFSDGTSGNYGIVGYDHSTDALRIFTASSERLRVDSSGRLGLGTSSPSALGRTINIYGGAGEGSSIALEANNGAEFCTIFSGSTAADPTSLFSKSGFKFATATAKDATGFSEKMRLDSSGRLGIGTTSPAATLHSRSDNAGSGSTPLLIQNRSISANTAAGISFAPNISDTADRSAIIYGVNESGGSGNATGLTFHTNANGSSPQEKARIDSAGRLLVGTSSTSSNNRLIVQSNTDSVTGPATLLLAKGDNAPGSGSSLGLLRFGGSTHTHSAEIYAIRDGGTWTAGSSLPTAVVFSTTADGASSPTERMRIRNNGELWIHSSGGDPQFLITNSTGAGTSIRLISGRYSGGTIGTGTESFRVFTNGNVENTNNSYGSISDIKLKENIVDANSQWDDLKALQVRKYNFKEGQTHTQIGLIAQEVELVSPGLVSESPDRDAEGNDLGTVTKSVNYSVLYMKAVKALQEAMERIEHLETEMVAVKAQLS
jgi:hypothetical protein